MNDEAAHNAVAYLKQAQLASGGFASLSSPEATFEHAKTYLTTFSTAIILNALNSVDNAPGLEHVKSAAAKFLLAQKNPSWSYNYWAAGSPEQKTLPYPDDADDTFAALSALTGFDAALLKAPELAQITHLLISLETKPGGPYRTWFAPPQAGKAWQDVDITPNAAIAYFLQSQSVVLAPLLKWLDSELSAGQTRSRYYPSELPVLYFLSRIVGLKPKGLIVKKIWARAKRKKLNPLDAALAITALINCGAKKEAAPFIKNLYRGRDFPALPFCLDPAISGRAYFHGSGALTAALTLEALAKFNALKKSHEPPGIEEQFRQTVIGRAQTAIAKTPSPLKEKLKVGLSNALKQDKSHSIILAPLLFQRAVGQRAQHIPQEQIADIALAQLYGWIGFSIFDDCIDGQISKDHLPAALYYIKLFIAAYKDICTPGEFRLVKKYYDATVAAYYHEQARKKFSTKQWINKSMGYALGSTIVSARSGFQTGSREMTAIENFFRNYLAARQLHDDAHDWQEDLTANRSTPATIQLKKDCHSANPSELQKIFWERSMDTIAKKIKRHVAAARAALNAETFLERPELLKAMLTPLERGADQALTQRDHIKQFLHELNGPP